MSTLVVIFLIVLVIIFKTDKIKNGDSFLIEEDGYNFEIDGINYRLIDGKVYEVSGDGDLKYLLDLYDPDFY